MAGTEERDPRCPECGEPIGQTAVYCMHCSTDLTEAQEASDTDDDEAWETRPAETAVESQAESESASSTDTPTVGSDSGELLDPDGLVDNTLTVVVGIVGGIVVGLVGTMELIFLTGSGWAVPLGFVAWLGSTAYLVRRRTVQGAVSKSGYAVAAVLLVAPLIALSPFIEVDGGLGERGGLLLVLLFFVGAPALVALGVGWVAGRFVPADSASNAN